MAMGAYLIVYNVHRSRAPPATTTNSSSTPCSFARNRHKRLRTRLHCCQRSLAVGTPPTLSSTKIVSQRPTDAPTLSIRREGTLDRDSSKDARCEIATNLMRSRCYVFPFLRPLRYGSHSIRSSLPSVICSDSDRRRAIRKSNTSWVTEECHVLGKQGPRRVFLSFEI
ncbi:hypothetical protein SCHPADRAFT_227898 [Schizopora paradoxa]|uniref:Uncharacterized protein n=1 Tax=Schizopora paradoxa TaxID=27342 RepID=A0A0H2RVM9_9AGAM|nr:hypothetical protein SCHPADRAFT_227898 [Schizopora paradoxa]